jgi:hypothetical protein
VLTLDPIDNELDETVDLDFTPPAAPNYVVEEGAQIEIVPDDAPEPLVGGNVDLGALAIEFLLLAMDPYPRKPGAVFEPPAQGDDKGHSFAALAALRSRRGRDAG